MVIPHAWVHKYTRVLARVMASAGLIVGIVAALLFDPTSASSSSAWLLAGAASFISIALVVIGVANRPRTVAPIDRVAQLRANLEISKFLIRQINAEFDLQVAAAEKIKAEAEQNQRLAELNAEQAQAVKKLVESVQSRASKLGSRQQWLFFLAGLLTAVPLGVVGNFVFELVKTWLASH